MTRRTSTIARRIVATVAVAGSIAVALVVGPAAQNGWSGGGGDGNWPKPTARSINVK